jgi:hypothetical protein
MAEEALQKKRDGLLRPVLLPLETPLSGFAAG